jgi:putative transposase
VLDLLRTPRFVDLAPAEIYATLLDEGVYVCSIRTLYRILAENGEVRERRDQRRHPVDQKPELLAEAPNQVWSWDITKLMGPAKWSYFVTAQVTAVMRGIDRSRGSTSQRVDGTA